MNKEAGFLSAFLLLSSLAIPSVNAGGSVDAAMSLYKSKHYKEAAAGFSQAVSQEPSRQLYHYLLANCLVHMKEHRRAEEEYKVAYTLDPSSSTGEFCLQALGAYNKRSGKPGTASNSDLDKAKGLIEKQIEFEKEKSGSLANRGQRTIQDSVEEELKQVDQWMQSEIQKLNEPLIFNPGARANPLLANPELLKEKEDQIRASAAAQKEQIKKSAKERSKVYESWKKDRETLLDETAENLKGQLEQPMGMSGVKLQSKGTGLYVRYYGKGGKNYWPDPHPATARIGDAAAAEAKPAENAVESDKRVDGKVIEQRVQPML
ncbi:MAG: tetratricopeptide repeat protein [Candidatus Obscuribacterales bacterium]|nr:tetratricopeptide repeat protein [Candidatus Obscuribacterales bacterium]